MPETETPLVLLLPAATTFSVSLRDDCCLLVSTDVTKSLLLLLEVVRSDDTIDTSTFDFAVVVVPIGVVTGLFEAVVVIIVDFFFSSESQLYCPYSPVTVAETDASDDALFDVEEVLLFSWCVNGCLGVVIVDGVVVIALFT